MDTRPEFVVLQHSIPSSYLQMIVDAGLSRNVGKASTERKQARSSRISWIQPTELPMFTALLGGLVAKINEEIFRCDLAGDPEPYQYTLYRNGDYYEWHMDKGAMAESRKLSATLQLSESVEYTGGDLELHLGTVEKMPRRRGTLVIFPSYVLHRVTHVTAGTRQSLVCWFGGPPWR
jgi:PKHD-type hydroxylase